MRWSRSRREKNNERERKREDSPSMFSLTRCGISSIRYSVSSRSKSTASIAGRSGEASGQVDILSVYSFFWFQTERSEERSNVFDGVVVVVFSASLPSACCSRFSTRSREGSKKEAPSPPRERQKRNKSDRHRVSFLFFFVRQVLSLALLTFLFAVPESFRSRVLLSSENQTQCVPPLSCRAALSAVRSLSSAPPPPQRDVRSRCSGSDDRICL